MRMRGMCGRMLLVIVMMPVSLTVLAQGNTEKLEKKLISYFNKYKGYEPTYTRQPRLVNYRSNEKEMTLTVVADENFAFQTFTVSSVENMYTKLRKTLPSPWNDYKLTLVTNGISIDEMIPDKIAETNSMAKCWGDIDVNGKPWVKNVSRPNKITQGLQDRHLSLWASHGRYYDQKKGRWKWQRPNLFCTTEDLFTQTIVVPMLIPMLENAGAVVFTPRERDWQKREVIIDNDDRRGSPYYYETTNDGRWTDTGLRGFAYHSGSYHDGENPFECGTARMVAASKRGQSQVSYQPNFAEGGRYAVYVSYQTLQNSVDDALYVVIHKGQQTHFRVNQRMGGGTWVYLGTFEFAKGCSSSNRVVVTNASGSKGTVTTDAVRFGGGMGNILRSGSVSGVPRALEGARYYAQWAGAPYSVYSPKCGADDYSDDIYTRPNMTNWLAGGSPFVPTVQGKNVPIELSLAVHSDAGYAKDGAGLIGTLSISTTNHNEGRLNSGISRQASYNFAQALLEGVNRDIHYKYGKWNKRSHWDKNYAETRVPEVPSSIIETLSHQNFPDMVYGQDPNFKFTLARSIYKTILRYVAAQHGESYCIQPLAPDHFRVEFSAKNKVVLRWNPVADPQEPSARPTSYNIYVAVGDADFDNGTQVKGNSCAVELKPGLLYKFRVTATNKGGESFPTETLTAIWQPEAKHTVMVVNGFHRLSSPAIRNTDSQQGFDLDTDPGVWYGKTAGWNGRQTCFDRTKMGIEGPGGLGYGGDELVGKFIVGNTFDYVVTHAQAIQSAKLYNVVSCSVDAVEAGEVNINNYHAVDLILGLEKDDQRSLVFYKAMKPILQKKLQSYAAAHGRLLVSGAYVASDMTSSSDQMFLQQVLKVALSPSAAPSSSLVKGLGTQFDIYRTLNEQHYAATQVDVLKSLSSAYCAMQYGNGANAAVAYSGKDYRSFTMAFPFECITSAQMRAYIMRGILNFLLN